jgi:hypothetical protein
VVTLVVAEDDDANDCPSKEAEVDEKKEIDVTHEPESLDVDDNGCHKSKRLITNTDLSG